MLIYKLVHSEYSNIDVNSEENFNEDIESVETKDIPNHDVLVGGFPCQDYSVASLLKNSKGLLGKKGVLWWSIYRILDEKKKKEGLNIELSEEIAQGNYSNLAIINHSPSEFVVDFIQMMPGVPKAKVKSRIILTPQHAKRLMKALNENVLKFEDQHGEIKDLDPSKGVPINFGGPAAQA